MKRGHADCANSGPAWNHRPVSHPDARRRFLDFRPEIISGNGRPLRLIGVNRSGTEYGCVQWGGIFDGPSTDGAVVAIAAWHVNAVRVPMNEDCWLGINGAPVSGLTASQYPQAIVQYVQLLQ